MLTSVATTGVGPADRLEAQLSPRLNLFTGDNGLGKTFVLDALWFVLTESWAAAPAFPRATASSASLTVGYEGGLARRTFDFPNQGWSGRTRPVEPLVVYLRGDGGVSIYDPLRGAFQFDARALLDGLTAGAYGGGTVQRSNGLIIDWVNWQFQHPERFRALTKVLDRLSPPNRVEKLQPGQPVRVSLTDPRDIPTIRSAGTDVPITHASAAVRRIVGLAYVLVWAWYEHVEAARLTRKQPASNVVLLADEIEAHLHPQWQRTILPALLDVMMELSAETKLQALVTTHSPLVLTSIETMVDEQRDALFHFDLADDTTVSLSKKPWQLRGTASAYLTSDIFGLKQDRSRETEQAIEEAKAVIADVSASPEKVKEVHERLLGRLKDTDPFWARWLYRAEQAGLAP